MYQMKLDMKNILLFLYLIIILGCSNSSDPLSENHEESAFGIFFLKDTLITETRFLNDNPAVLKL